MKTIVETIAILDGAPRHLGYHQKRFEAARSELGLHEHPVLAVLLAELPAQYCSGWVKARVLYDPDLRELQYEHYEFKPVRSVTLVYAQDVDYHIKYADRSVLQGLFAQRGDADDIIIVNNGKISDAFSSNLVFEDAAGNLVTPADCLLPGTCRQRLLDEGRITAVSLGPEDLGSFRRVHLINAFRELGSCVVELPQG